MIKNSLRFLQRGLLVALLAGGLLLNSGCFLLFVGAVAGATVVTVKYVDGGLDATYGNDYDSVVAATHKAIDQLGFAQPEERKDALSDTLNTHNAQGKSISIVITRMDEKTTQVAIRVGAIGDKDMATAINDKIKSDI
jgi:hypothetical protein